MSHPYEDEVKIKVEAERSEIDGAVDLLVPNYLRDLEWALEAEFGKAIMRIVDMEPFSDILRDLARVASDKAMSITSSNRLEEARQNVGGVLSALLSKTEESK